THVDLDLLLGHLLELGAQRVDAGPLAPDDHPWPRRVDDDMHLVGLPLNLNAADPGLGQLGTHQPADLAIFCQLGVIGLTIGKPAALMLCDDSETESSWMYFATHAILLVLLLRNTFFQHHRNVGRTADPGLKTAPRAKASPPASRRLIGHNLGDVHIL